MPFGDSTPSTIKTSSVSKFALPVKPAPLNKTFIPFLRASVLPFASTGVVY